MMLLPAAVWMIWNPRDAQNWKKTLNNRQAHLKLLSRSLRHQCSYFLSIITKNCTVVCAHCQPTPTNCIYCIPTMLLWQSQCYWLCYRECSHTFLMMPQILFLNLWIVNKHKWVNCNINKLSRINLVMLIYAINTVIQINMFPLVEKTYLPTKSGQLLLVHCSEAMSCI